MEVWLAGSNIAGEARNMARQAEDEGFDGISFGDTQCLSPDPFVGLTAAATVTDTLKLCVGVTNPVTRHPAVTACAIASVHVESGGRAVLGLGRGDSAVSKLNRRAASVAALRAFLADVQRYLAGEVPISDPGGRPLEGLANVELGKVPVDVAATGPGVIEIGATGAERLSFNVGADRDQIAANVATARAARRASGLDPDGVSFGAWLPVAPHPSMEASRDLVKGVTAAYARFQAMPGHSLEGVRAQDARVIRAIGDNYDNSRHGRADAAHVALLEEDFIDRFAVVGPPQRCIERLWELIDLGLDRLLIVGPNRLGSPEDYTHSRRLLVEEVIPGLRRLELAQGVPS